MRSITKFEGNFDFLSNFYMCNIRVNKNVFPSVEHAYQAAKMTNKENMEKVMNCTYPGQAKKLARSLPCVDNWDKKKEHVMYELLMKKFAIPELAKKLKDTGNAELIEQNFWHDNYWGDCFCNKCLDIPGKNMLGKQLMKIREIYLKRRSDKNTKKEREQMWEFRKEKFEIKHQKEIDSYFKQNLYAILVTANGSQYAGVTVIGIDELVALRNYLIDLCEKENINDQITKTKQSIETNVLIHNEDFSVDKNWKKRVLKRRSKDGKKSKDKSKKTQV